MNVVSAHGDASLVGNTDVLTQSWSLCVSVLFPMWSCLHVFVAVYAFAAGLVCSAWSVVLVSNMGLRGVGVVLRVASFPD